MGSVHCFPDLSSLLALSSFFFQLLSGISASLFHQMNLSCIPNRYSFLIKDRYFDMFKEPSMLFWSMLFFKLAVSKCRTNAWENLERPKLTVLGVVEINQSWPQIRKLGFKSPFSGHQYSSRWLTLLFLFRKWIIFFRWLCCVVLQVLVSRVAVHFTILLTTPAHCRTSFPYLGCRQKGN